MRSRRKLQRADHRPHPRRAHQPPEHPRVSLQNVLRVDRHEHRVLQSKQAQCANSSNADRTGRSLIANRNPCAKLFSGESVLGLISLGAMRISSSATITATKLNPFRKKHHPAPTSAIANPAIAGPTALAPLKIEEFSAMAFGKSSFPTICTKKACRIGTSNALTMPTRNAITIKFHLPIKWAHVNPASTNARSMVIVCVTITPRCRSKRSPTYPPSEDRKSIGTWLANPNTPSKAAECVS